MKERHHALKSTFEFNFLYEQNSVLRVQTSNGIRHNPLLNILYSLITDVHLLQLQLTDPNHIKSEMITVKLIF